MRDLEDSRIIPSSAACKRLRHVRADITNAYLQGKVDRIFTLALQPDGLDGVPQAGALLCRVPIYNQKDAGRRLYVSIGIVLVLYFYCTMPLHCAGVVQLGTTCTT